MSTKILAFAALAVIASVLIANMQPSKGVDTQFENFKFTHQKTYLSADE
jgi:hypothetical protein